MLSRSRFLLSLVVALSLSTLASADSAPVSMTFMHSTGVYGGAQSYSGHASINSGTATPMILAAFNHPSSEKWNAQVGGALSGKEMLGKNDAATRSNFLDDRHGTISRKNGDWAVWHVGEPGSPMATPEPGSLMLLSTGLIGVAGVVRRKMRRA
jgi:hypothetical protein